MEYQFDYATFCKTFNVKDDKAIDTGIRRICNRNK